jgi:mRNA-degrading endonuclease toxin of MazEF toxin-antitoxin module
VVLVSRDEVYRLRSHVLVVPVTTRVRGLPVEVALDARAD